MFKLIKLIWSKIKQLQCEHEFLLSSLGKRNVDGNLIWSCHKCNKVYTVHYGLKILDHGKIVNDKWNQTKEIKKEKKTLRELINEELLKD